jgi:flagellar motor switch protein FliG
MSYLKKELASHLLSLLPGEVQKEVILKMSRISLIAPKVLEDLKDRLKKRIDFLTGGVEQIIEILNFADKDTEQSILRSLEKENPELAKEVKKHLFTFEDIIRLDSKALRNILQEVKIGDLAIALSAYPDDYRIIIMGNLSEGSAKMLEEESKFLSPEAKLQAREKQQEIVRKIRQMEKEGKVIIKREGIE